MAAGLLNNWTIMVYMAGDNNLSIDMVYSLEQLKKAAQGSGLKLFVYFDGFSTDVPTLYCDFSDTPHSDEPNRPNFYQSNKIENKLIDVENKLNENSAAVNNIINFVSWCVNRDSADEIKDRKYAFIFSGHTLGFVNKGLFRDEKANYYMTHSKLKYMFERITSTKKVLLVEAAEDEKEFTKRYGKKWDEKRRTERTTQIIGKSLDLLGFDTCVMSTLEIACQFRHFSKTMVASEGSIPTAGWNYAQILLKNISEESESDSTKLAVSFVDEFIKQQNKLALADISVDISAWNLQNLSPLEKALEKMADNLLECFEKKDSVSYHQMRRLIVYAHWQCQTYMLEQHIDLGDFCQLLIQEIDLLQKEITTIDLTLILNVKDSCKNVIDSIRNCILLTGFSGSDFQFSNGISLFFPWSWVSYQSASRDYNNLTFIQKNEAGIKWNEFLQTFLRDVTLRVPNLPTNPNDINAETTTVIYESYELEKDSDISDLGESNSSSVPKTGKQFPNSSRQFPNSSRQFPNSSRMSGEISTFLARFMKLKNFTSNWNWAGFTSKSVVFRPESVTGSSQNNDSPSNEKMVINIPIARNIQNEFNEINLRLDVIKQNFAQHSKIEQLQSQLEHTLEKTNRGKSKKILADLSHLKILNSTDLTDTDITSDLEKAFAIINSTE